MTQLMKDFMMYSQDTQSEGFTAIFLAIIDKFERTSRNLPAEVRYQIIYTEVNEFIKELHDNSNLQGMFSELLEYCIKSGDNYSHMLWTKNLIDYVFELFIQLKHREVTDPQFQKNFLVLSHLFTTSRSIPFANLFVSEIVIKMHQKAPDLQGVLEGILKIYTTLDPRGRIELTYIIEQSRNNPGNTLRQKFGNEYFDVLYDRLITLLKI